MLRYFRIKLFPNKTTLFYRSQLHVPLYVRNRGWGSRYHGLCILTPTPNFCFWNYKNFIYVSKECSDIFESNCFLTKLLYFIGHSYMSILRLQKQICKYLRNNYYVKLHWFYNYSREDFRTSEAQVWVGVKIPGPRYLEPHSVFLTDCAISYQDHLKKANI